MYKYFGVSGQRGAGKDTVSYLLGVTIDYYLTYRNFIGFESVYNNAIETIKNNEDAIVDSDFKRVYFESFADIPRITICQLIGIDPDLTRGWRKDYTFINLKDFEHRIFSNECTSDEFESLRSKCLSVDKVCKLNNFQEDTWISLRDLILYFGNHVMTNAFGRNIWVKSLKANNTENRFIFNTNASVYKIFTSIKFPSEADYIKEHDGFIIHVTRDYNKKHSNLGYYDSGDFEIDLSNNKIEDCRVLFENIVENTIQIK